MANGTLAAKQAEHGQMFVPRSRPILHPLRCHLKHRPNLNGITKRGSSPVHLGNKCGEHIRVGNVRYTLTVINSYSPPGRRPLQRKAVGPRPPS